MHSEKQAFSLEWSKEVGGHTWLQATLVKYFKKPLTLWKWHVTRKKQTNKQTELILKLALFISAVRNPVQELPEKRTCHLAEPKQYITVFQVHHFMGYLIQCLSSEDVHVTQPISLSAPSVVSKRFFSVYSAMFFIMKLTYCLLFFFWYSKCWIIAHGSVWPGSDVISLAALFLL